MLQRFSLSPFVGPLFAETGNAKNFVKFATPRASCILREGGLEFPQKISMELLKVNRHNVRARMTNAKATKFK